MGLSEIDSFLIESGRRKIVLYRQGFGIPYVVSVQHKRFLSKGKFTWIEISTSEYQSRELADRDFENRRPKMRDATGEDLPMQKGKRLIQEVMKEVLG